MFFQAPETGSAIQTVANIIASLTPAFAIGFAIQRLIEVVDSWISLHKRVGPEWKAAILKGISLVIGIAIAIGTSLTIIAKLGFAINAFLDYLLTGLIISAGTEGLNSIVKFLLYSKETKKAEAATQRETAVSVRRVNKVQAYSTMARNRLRSVTTSAVPEGEIPSGDTKKDLRKSLHDHIQREWPDEFVEDGWADRKFEVFPENPDRAKVVVNEALVFVATAYDETVDDDVIFNLQEMVTNETTPEDILPHMLDALLLG